MAEELDVLLERQLAGRQLWAYLPLDDFACGKFDFVGDAAGGRAGRCGNIDS